MRWQRSDRFDPALCALADRHYSRQKIGSPQFVPPGRCVVLRTAPGDAVWATSWPFAEFTKHKWCGPTFPTSAWSHSSMPAKTRQKRDPGYCYLMAGFQRVGMTKGGLVALQMLPGAMPEPEAPDSPQGSLLDLIVDGAA